MSVSEQKRAKKRNPTYVSSILSVSLILFILGVIGVFFLQSAKLGNSIKENLLVQLVLADKMSESEQLQFSKQLETEVFVKEAKLVKKEEAAELMKEDLGENFLDVVGYNPLPDAVELHIKAAYAHPDSLLWIKDKLLAKNKIEAVHYDENLLKNVNSISSKVLLGISAFLVLLFLISYIIIDNSIKLAMFSQRFIIRSMQLVGAKPWFIKKPFIVRGVLNGVLSAIIACIFIVGLVFLFERYIIPLSIFNNYLDFIIIFGTLVLIGILVSLASTFFAVRKYLRMKLDDLY